MHEIVCNLRVESSGGLARNTENESYNAENKGNLVLALIHGFLGY